MEAHVKSIEPRASVTTPGLAWKWILEKLVDLPDFGVAFINEVITTHVTDIEESHCRLLLERVALRNLEEMVVTNQIDSDAIPLLKALTGQDLGAVTIGSSVKQRFNKELVLRVQTEVVLSVLRKDVDGGENDWAHYASEIERIFAEEEEDNRLLDRKRELSALLKPKNQTKANVAAYFEKYSFNKLRSDLYMFLDEKRESFKTMFLDQLSLDFLGANGTPFPDELRDVERSKVDALPKQGHVGTVKVESLQTLTSTHTNGDMNLQKVGHETGNGHDVHKTGDEHNVLGTATVSGKKRLRRKLLPVHGDSGDGESEELQEYKAELKKPRKVILISPVSPVRTLLHQDVSETAMPRFSPQNDDSVVKHGVESSKRGEEGMPAPRILGLEVMRSCIPPVHASVSMEVAKVPLRESSRSNKYVAISDVESDADTQVVKRSSTDEEEGDLIEKCEGDDHLKEEAQSVSHSKNESDQGHPSKIVATEVVRNETIVVPSERRISEARRKEAFTCSPEAKIAQQRNNEMFVTKQSIPLDTQDSYEVDFLEVGSDGHEEFCHRCGLHGELLCCDGCPISMHFECLEALGLRLPKGAEDWYCPVCLSAKAARELAEVVMAAAAAKEKLKAFMKESIRKRSSPVGDALHHRIQEKAVKSSRFRVNALQPDENDIALKLQQQDEAKSKLRYTEVQHDSGPPKESLLPTLLRKALNQLKKRGEEESDNMDQDSLPLGRVLRVHQPLSNASPKSLIKDGAESILEVSAKSVPSDEGVKITERMPDSSHRKNSRRHPLAASTSGPKRKETDISARSSKREGHGDDNGEESAGQKAAVREPGSGTGGCGEVEGDKHDGDLDEDRDEKYENLKRSAFFSGRRKLPGLRRKPLPWTREEEDALKEGVKQFSHNGAWGFQWKRILNFGTGRFDPSRTDVDLKDKWRNLVKGVS